MVLPPERRLKAKKSAILTLEHLEPTTAYILWNTFCIVKIASRSGAPDASWMR
jgi:hypothetical protein